MIKLNDRIRRDTIKSIVRWRLSDHYWNGSFESLVNDLNTCSDHSVSEREVLDAMRRIIQSEPQFAERALRLALDAQRLLIERKTQRNITWLRTIAKVSNPHLFKGSRPNWLKSRIGIVRSG